MHSRSSRIHLTLAFCLAIAASLQPFANAAPVDPSIDLPISVRSFVDKPFGGFRRKSPVAHGKDFAIIALNKAADSGKLARPVAEGEMLAHLRQVLKAQGFREVETGQTPEILLTLLYGRGLLQNPYLAGVVHNEMTEPPIVYLSGAFPEQLMKQKEAFFEAKLQKANHEKLFIRVTAWKYPGAKKEKPQELWNTTMIYDDPDRDLNQLMKEMLTSGAPYFDREIEKEEVEIRRTIPKGEVNVGTPEVIDRPSPKTQK